MVMRPIRALALTTLGAFGGFAAAAAVVKRMLPSSGGEDSDELALVAVFDGIDLTNRATAFRAPSAVARRCASPTHRFPGTERYRSVPSCCLPR